MAERSDYFCNPQTTPTDIYEALNSGHVSKLRDWCKKQSPELLTLALECLHPHHMSYREVINTEIASKIRVQESEISNRRHNEAIELSQRTLRWTIAAAVAAIIGAFLTAAGLLFS